jgi:hypothetical protein
VEKLRTYGGPPYYTTVTFEVISVSGTPESAEARIRVTSIGNPDHVPMLDRIHSGTLGALRLRDGVVTDSLTHATFCAPNVDRCGL